jgi:hypothetical protein
MNHGELQPQYVSNTADGPVTITAQLPIVSAPAGSFNVYYAFALGANEQAMLANIAAAEAKYQGLITSVDPIESSVDGFSLGQNHPNPFKQSTTISYQVPDDGFVSLKVYNVVGSEVATLVNSNQTRGSHTIQFNANDLNSGVYYYTLRYNDQVKSSKMLLIK